MKYNFDEVIDRSRNRSAKYDERVKNFGTDDVIPLWIADMDFKTAQPIIDACVKKSPGRNLGLYFQTGNLFPGLCGLAEKKERLAAGYVSVQLESGRSAGADSYSTSLYRRKRQGHDPAARVSGVL